MEINTQNYNNNANEEVDIVEILRDYTKYWKWFIFSVVLALFLGIIVIFSTQKEYKSDLSILIDENKQGKANTALANLEQLGVTSYTNNIDNEIIMLQSPDLMKDVVDTLNLQVNCYIRGFIGKKTEMYKDFPFVIKIEGENRKNIKYTEFYIKRNKNKYVVCGTIDNININKEVTHFPIKITTNNKVEVNINLTFNEIIDGKKYYVSIASQYNTAQSIVNNLDVSLLSKNSSVLNLSLKSNNGYRGAAVLNELVRQYNILNISMKNEIGYNTYLFINDRLKEITIELGQAEGSLVGFKQQHGITDISSEAQAFVQQTSETERRLLDIETQLNVIAMVEKFLKNPSNQSLTIPNLGITDVSLTSIISQYNSTLLAAEMELRGMGEEAPRRKVINDNLGSVRSSILTSLQSVKQSYNVVRDELLKKTAQTRSRIHSVPMQEIGLMERTRKQQIIENLFLFLMQKREETNLNIASAPNKARIIISPSEKFLPVAPKSRIIMLAMLLIGFIVPICVIYLKNLLNTRISNRHELEKRLQVPIIGQIARNNISDSILIRQENNREIFEMFRSLRNNTNFILKNQNNRVILITSTTQGEGKTFITANLAISYVLTGKKILLVGADIRNPKLKNIFDLKNKSGLSQYLAYQDDWHNYVYPSGKYSNLNVIPGGAIPPNPNELLLEDTFKRFIEQAKQEYDFVIIDTAPVGLVSDTYLIDDKADITIYVIREGLTPKDSINFINTQKAEGKLTNMYVVFNDSHLDANYKYGYGAEYGYK
jgi:capsular exopolysaccharide synthesis family protein